MRYLDICTADAYVVRMDGTLDEDYHKEQKSIINTLKRIIKKYDKK